MSRARDILVSTIYYCQLNYYCVAVGSMCRRMMSGRLRTVCPRIDRQTSDAANSPQSNKDRVLACNYVHSQYTWSGARDIEVSAIDYYQQSCCGRRFDFRSCVLTTLLRTNTRSLLGWELFVIRHLSVCRSPRTYRPYLYGRASDINT